MTNLKNLKALKHRIIWGKHTTNPMIVITLASLTLGLNLISPTHQIKSGVETLSSVDINPMLNYKEVAPDSGKNEYPIVEFMKEAHNIENPTNHLQEMIEYEISLKDYVDTKQDIMGSYDFSKYFDTTFKVLLYGSMEDLGDFKAENLHIIVDLTNQKNAAKFEAPIIIEYSDTKIKALSNYTSISMNPSEVKEILFHNWKKQLILPIDNATIICGWNGYPNHKAIDIQNPKQAYTNIYAVSKGIVSEVGYDDASGNFVVINHLNDIMTRYGHLNKPSTLKEGQTINQGDIIGITGMSGIATTPHVHFAMEIDGARINPTTWLFK